MALTNNSTSDKHHYKRDSLILTFLTEIHSLLLEDTGDWGEKRTCRGKMLLKKV